MSYPTEALATIIANAPVADTPSSSDVLLLLQGGLLKRLPANALPALETIPTEVVNQATYNATIDDQAILVNRSPAGATVINLPSNPGAGRRMLIKDIAGNNAGYGITIGNATIDGIVGGTITANYGYVWLLSTGDGDNWAAVT